MMLSTIEGEIEQHTFLVASIAAREEMSKFIRSPTLFIIIKIRIVRTVSYFREE
jgi:hypothetical protein